MDKSSGNVGKSSEGRKLGRWRNFFARPKCFRIMFNDTVRDTRFFFPWKIGKTRRKAREPSYSPFPTWLNATIPGSGVARSSPMNDSEFQDTPPVIFLFSFDRARFVNGRNLSEVSQDKDKESGGCLVMGTGSWISDHR